MPAHRSLTTPISSTGLSRAYFGHDTPPATLTPWSPSPSRFVRSTAFLLTCPPFSSRAIPFVAQTGIAGGLALAAVNPLMAHPLVLTTPGLIESLVVQVVVGAMIGFVVQLFFSAVQGAGTLADTFTGLNLPPAIDPLSIDQVPLIGQLYQWLATVLIFTTGGVAPLVRGFLHSFTRRRHLDPSPGGRRAAGHLVA